ncbi:MAG: YihY/virulence factor BrkB family protein, partial [Fusobacterium sp.]|nr:YihY/virulence factor BrkB family protein [Fusobacterium sp.]
MDKFLNLMTIDNVAEGVKRAYEKYKTANSTFWVTSLSFYTIVALVPIAAILFSLGSWFGAKDYIIHQITETTPLPMEVLELISTFAENLLKNARNGLLAGIGFLFLGWTFIKMFSLIEDSFNDIWHIKIPRTFVRKISDYVAFFIFLPLVFIIINGATILLLSKIESVSILHQLLSKIIPYTSLLVFLSA